MIRNIIVPKVLDEQTLVTLWLLKSFGKKHFKGADNAKVTSRSVLEAVYKGDLVLVPEGLKQCAGIEGDLVTKVVSKLGLEDNQALLRTIGFFLKSDQGNGVRAMFSLIASTFSEARSISWFMQCIEAKYDEQCSVGNIELENLTDAVAPEIAEAAKNDVAEFSRVIQVKRPDGNDIKVGLVVSQDGKTLAGGLDLLVVQNPVNYGISILGRFSLRDVARILRIEEATRRSGMSTPYARHCWREFSETGVHDKVPQWEYVIDGGTHRICSGINGGQLTTLRIDEVTNLVRIAVDNSFMLYRANKCRQQVCTGSFENPCPWYRWNLTKCRGVRGTMLKEQMALKPRRKEG